MKEKISPVQKALNLWAIILIVWSIYRANIRMPEWFDELIAKPTIFILPVYYYIRKIEKKDFFSALNLKIKTIIPDLVSALMIGGLFFSAALLANFLKFKKIVFANQPFILSNFFLFFLIALFTGLSEEILSRGFVLKKLYENSKNIYSSSFFASILFFFLHVPILFTNIKITGNLLLMFMAMDIILSLAISFIFLARRSLILAILIHAFYNLSISLFL